MTAIKKLIDGSENQYFPQTHTKAVIDDQGNSVDGVLDMQTQLINQAQMAIGAVPSDLKPTKDSSNWVTSGGVYNAVTALSAEIYKWDIVSPSTISSGWALTGVNGLCVADSSASLVKYQVTAGTKMWLKLSKDNGGVYQWQNNASVGAQSNTYLIGSPVTTATDSEVTVPDGATYLIVSQNNSNTTNGVSIYAGSQIQKNKEDIAALSDELGFSGLTYERVWKFSNGDIVENALIGNGNTVYTAGLFVTPYIDVTDVKSHQWKWYIGTDRSGYSGNIASLRIELFDENKTYKGYYSYNSDPRTFSLTSADQTETKYIRITFVMADDCYLQDIETGDYIWYGYYIGKKIIEEAIGVVDIKANTNKAEISKAENILARVNDFSKGDITDNSFYYNGNILSARGVFLTNFLTIDPSHTYVWYQGTDRSGVSGVSVAGLMLVVFDANGSQINQYSYNADPRTFNSFNSSVAKVRVSFVANNDCYLFDKTDNKYIWYGYYTGMDKILDTINNNYPKSYAFYETNLIQSRIPHRDVASATSGKILSLLHFSDIHGQATPLQHILAFKDKYSSYVDDILFTGDLVNDHFGQTNIFENVSGAENILFTTGNHDVWLGSAESPYNNVPYSNVSTLQVYNEYIAPFVANWGVVQPANASILGLNYYYKDYDNVRLVVLDCFAPSGSTYRVDEVTWLSGVLSSAKTSNKAVVIAVHQTAADLDYERETGFCSYERTISEFIDGSFVNAVQSFIDAGGEFVCWLAGHVHTDFFGTLANNPQQTQITITCAYLDQYDDGRVVGTPTADSFNIVSFDTYSKLIKILRVGNNEDRYLRPKNVLTWDYANKKIVSTF